MSTAKINDNIDVMVKRAEEKMGDQLTGIYDIEVRDKDGNLKHQSRHTNLITTEGKRYLLDAGLGNSGTFTLQTAWYVRLVSSVTVPAVTQSYTAPVSTEFTNYTEANRVTWTGVVDGTAGSITNSASKAEFTADTGGGTVTGACLVSRNTKSDATAGDYMVSYSQFSTPVTLLVSDKIYVTITIAFA